MTSVQIAEVLLKFEGAATLAALHGPGHKCDEAPVRVAMQRMFPREMPEDLEAGLQLAVTIAWMDIAEQTALDHP